MSKIQSFIMDDPVNSVFRGAKAEDTRMIMSLTPYDMRLIAEMMALVSFPGDYRGKEHDELKATASQVGVLIIDHLEKAWNSLNPAEQKLGLDNRMRYEDD